MKTDVDEIRVRLISGAAVEAAKAIFDRMSNAQHHDVILGRAHAAFPSTDFADTLARVTLLDALYATRLLARSRMAEHICSLGDLNTWSEPQDLVDAIARLPQAPKHTRVVETTPNDRVAKSRTHKSFASKYAHIFVDSARYHILDEASLRMVAWHTHSTLTATKTWTYVEFNRRAEAVRRGSGLAADRSLDRYLWVAGMRYRDRAGGPVNTELVGVFQSSGSRADVAQIDAVLPTLRKARKPRRKT